MSLSFEVYTMDKPYDILNIIPRRTKVSLSNELSEVGGGSLTMQRNDPKFVETPNLMDYRNIVKCRKPNGKYVGGFLVQSNNSTHIDSDEAAGETETYGGEGLLTWFRDATVEPYGGLRQDSSDSRTFSFASERGAWYIPEDWTAPQTAVKYLDPSPWGTAPAEWPDAPEAKWIWPTANATEQNTKVGTAYFRREFVLDKEYKAALFFAGDDEFEVYIDGQQVMKVETGETWQKTYRVDTTITQGEHVLAVKIRNTGGPAGLIGALRIWGDPNVPSSAFTFIYTGDSEHGGWKTMGYPEEEPGWTPGEIVLSLFNEAKKRGVQFTGIVKPTFTATHDSNGEKWSTKRPWEFEVGLEYLEVLQKLTELYCDVEIDIQNYNFNLWNSRGKDLTVVDNPIRFRRGVSVLMSSSQGKAPIKNTLNIKTADGWITKQDTQNSVARYGRIEGKISTELGLDVSNDVASIAFEQVATPEEAATMQFIPAPGLVPFEDYNLGDWVFAPGKTPNEKRRIMSLSVAESDTTVEKYEAEFDTLFRTKQDRLSRSMDTLTAGSSMTGRLANATTDRPSGGLGTPAFNSGQDTGVPGSGGGTGGGTGTTPASPVGLTVTTFGYWNRDGAAVSQLTASWNPVTRATDGSGTAAAYYQIWGRDQSARTLRNGITNPSFETTVTGVVAAGCTISRDTSWADVGNYSLRLTPNTSSVDSYVSLDNGRGGLRSGMVGGTTYTASATIRLPVAMTGTNSGQARTISINYVDSSGTQRTILSSAAPATAGVTRVSVTASLPTGITEAWIQLYNGSSTTSPAEVFWDSISVVASSSAVPYFDGASGTTGSGTARWEGAAHASASIFEPSTPKTLLGISQGPGVVLKGLEPGVPLAISVAAVNAVGNTGGSSTEVVATTAFPASSLGRPSTPVLTLVNGAIRVDWDGLLSSTAPPAQFDYVYASISNIATGPWESVGQNLVRKGSIVLEGVASGDRYVRLIAVDRARQESPASVVVKITLP